MFIKKRKHGCFKVLFVLLFVIILIIVISNIVFPRGYSDYVEAASKTYNIDVNLIYAVIKTESGFNTNAVSSRDASGLMQIMEQTGKWASEEMMIVDYNKKMLFDPAINIAIGCWYLDNLNKQFAGNIDLVLAAYNAGSGNVSKWLSESIYSADGKSLNKIPFEETRKYLRKVKAYQRIYHVLNSFSD